jgi:hypothetical protein
MFDVMGDSVWSNGAQHAQLFVQSMWDDTNGCYLAGTTSPDVRNDLPGELPLDTQSWSVLSLTNALALHPQLLNDAEALLGCSSDGFAGFDFNDDQDGVWFEGTGQMCVAYALSGAGQTAATLAETLGNAQQMPSPVGDGLGMVAASHNGLTTGFSTEYGPIYYNCRLHVGATAWDVFAQLGFNPYYQTFIVEPGVYSGLVYSSNSTTGESVGTLENLKVGPKGTFTGKLLMGGQKYSLSGAFNPFGNARVRIPRSTKLGGPLILELALNCAVNPSVLTGMISAATGG